jgi:uncharacterized MAPEG superfamily protein
MCPPPLVAIAVLAVVGALAPGHPRGGLRAVRRPRGPRRRPVQQRRRLDPARAGHRRTWLAYIFIGVALLFYAIG